MNVKAVLLAVLAVGSVAAAWAYERKTHEEITEAAVRGSTLVGNDNLDRVGLNRRGVTPSDLEVIVSILRQGANLEDSGLRPVNHFFDPINDIGLLGTFSKSPDWALGETFVTNDYSYRKAKDYLREAILATDPPRFYTNLTQMYRSLGQVVHHIEDMAQPEHARNDQHLVPFDTSLYERFTFDQHEGKDPDPTAKARFFQNLNKPYGGPPVLAAPRDYWTTPTRHGMADFTNRNFVSKDTNFRLLNGQPAAGAEYAAPQPTALPSEVAPLAELMPQGGLTCNALLDDPNVLFTPGATCDVEFYGTDVVDHYRGGTSEFNLRASSLSVFDQYLTRFNITTVEIGKSGLNQPVIFVDRLFALNRFNYASAHTFLLHRAAAYSTGLLDHFFRGELEIKLPLEGAFAVVDHSGEGGNPKFRKLKLKLRNVTPPLQTPGGAVTQNMNGGQVRAVVRYWLNPCYEADLSGELNEEVEVPSGCALDTYVSGAEGIAVSAPLSVGALQSETDLTFDFGDKPIPINIRDALLQVVYTGSLGSETDAVVIGMLNISEPTYLMVFNNTDYFGLDGVFYTPGEIRDDPALLAKVDFNGDGVEDIDLDPVPIHNIRYGVSGTFWTGPATIQPKAFTRIAVLVDSSQPIPLRIPFQFQSGSLGTHVASVQPVRLQLTRDPSQVSAFAKVRGFHHWQLLYLSKNQGVRPPDDSINDLPMIEPRPQPTEVTVTYLQ